jgi:hypothetical protein
MYYFFLPGKCNPEVYIPYIFVLESALVKYVVERGLCEQIVVDSQMACHHLAIAATSVCFLLYSRSRSASICLLVEYVILKAFTLAISPDS